MKYGSVCSGVEAASVAWHPLGWEPQWFSEIEKFPSAVLANHYPDVPNFGDMTKFKEWPNDRSIDLLVGGTPCQSFSVAGLRKGLDDPRGNLMLTYLAIAERYRPRWLVWENVPGVLSSNKGRDFGTFLGALGKLNYGFASRVLDAQYFGVAQRRKRVFVVGYLGDWRPAAAVLFERESLSGNTAPRRTPGQSIAPTVTQGPPFSRTGNERVECEAIVPVGYTSSSFGNYSEGVGTIRAAGGDLGGGSETLVPEVAGSLDTECGGSETLYVADTLTVGANQYSGFIGEPVLDVTTHRMRGFGDYASDGSASALKARDYKDATDLIAFPAEMSGTQSASTTELSPSLAVTHTTAVAWSIMPMNSGKDYKARQVDVAQPLMAGGPVGGNQGGDFVQSTAVAYDTTNITSPENGSNPRPGDPVYTLASGQHPPLLTPQVRRLTPTECERLQGFPDNYTKIAWRGKISDDCPDGPRYKAMGNSMAVPVMRWIGERINAVENIKSKQEEKP